MVLDPKLGLDQQSVHFHRHMAPSGLECTREEEKYNYFLRESMTGNGNDR